MQRSGRRRTAVLAAILLALVTVLFGGVVVGCGEATPNAADALAAARKRAEGSHDGEVVGRWLVGELVADGGSPVQAIAARKALDAIQPRQRGLYASISRAVDDEAHGRFVAAASELTDAIDAARTYEGTEGPILGWYAVHHLLRLRPSVPRLWESAKNVVEAALDKPGNLGFRARGELVDLWVFESGGRSSWSIDLAAKKLGCVQRARLAGPFGRLAPGDSMRSFDAERPGPWPMKFAADPRRVDPPRVIKAKISGCQITADEAADVGVYYVETFIDLPHERDVIVAVQGAWSISVDDNEVMSRDPDTWASWPRFGVKLHLEAGRHRIIGRVGGVDTSVRVIDSEGRPVEATSSDDPAAPYSLQPPTLLADPNPLDPYLDALGVPARPRAASAAASARLDSIDPVQLFFASEIASTDGQDDLAGVLIEPLVKDQSKATGISLAQAASYIEGDPIFAPNDARDLALDLRTRATEKDGLLWYPRLWLALDAAEKQGVTEVMPKLTELAEQFREVPGIVKGVAGAYARLGWKAEHARTVREAAKRFPDDPEVLRAELGLADETGQFDEVNRIVERLKVLEPSTPIDVERAIAKNDFSGAVVALEKAQGTRRDVKDLAARIEELLTRAGRSKETFEALEKALADDPKSDKARLALADAEFAGGDKRALRKALVEAIGRGGDTEQLRSAIELVEGVSELSAYRIDGLATIRDYERSGAAKTPDDEEPAAPPPGAKPTTPRRGADAPPAAPPGRPGAPHAPGVSPPPTPSGAGSPARPDAPSRPDAPVRPGAPNRPAAPPGPTAPPTAPPSGEPQAPNATGNAARVLDYSAMWIHEDGTARMLEHEILQMRSREAIAEHAEQQIPKGMLLHIRTIKRDGTIYEPELVQGKPTVTMPHLDVGDYIETETIYTIGGDGSGGKSFVGPRWFFREEKIDYYRSEFVIVSPKDRPLDVEITGDVPAPQIKEDGAIVTRRYRVDKNPAVPEEPLRAPAEEFLPSVRIGWGVSQTDTLERLVDLSASRTPVDPRLRRIAETIVANGKGQGDAKSEVRKLAADERARRIYRWVLANIEAGRENDPRRSVTGKRGSRVEAFIYLARLVGVDVQRSVVSDRLAPPPRGPISEAELFTTLAVAVPRAVETGADAHGKIDSGKSTHYRFMLVGDKYAPYGFMPSALRGQPAVLLVPGLPRITTPLDGSSDRVEDVGDVVLANDGSATMTIAQSYTGRLGIGLRNALETLPEARLKDAIESQLLPESLPGARLDSVDVKHLDDLDSPLSLAMKIEISAFAKPRGASLVLSPPFSPGIGSAATLTTRQTPLFISEQVALSRHVRLMIALPKGAKVQSPLGKVEGHDGDRSFVVDDRVEGETLVLERTIRDSCGSYPAVCLPGVRHFRACRRSSVRKRDRDLEVGARRTQLHARRVVG